MVHFECWGLTRDGIKAGEVGDVTSLRSHSYLTNLNRASLLLFLVVNTVNVYPDTNSFNVNSFTPYLFLNERIKL